MIKLFELKLDGRIVGILESELPAKFPVKPRLDGGWLRFFIGCALRREARRQARLN